jgi:tRNA threonylcarbamoyladenosine biosynthesis protein TsaB
MALILNIDTATDKASVCLSRDGAALDCVMNDSQQEHASWLHVAISKMLIRHNFQAADLAAVAVTIGPGSYTGLRVSLSAAKGLCYALSIPLIAVSTLEVTAYAVRSEAKDLICAMIDARRMEVFTAIFDKSMHLVSAPSATIIDDKSFDKFLEARDILFCGNAVPKTRNIINSEKASFSNTPATAKHLGEISLQYFLKKQFSDLAYVEPFYIKEFYSPERKPLK